MHAPGSLHPPRPDLEMTHHTTGQCCLDSYNFFIDFSVFDIFFVFLFLFLFFLQATIKQLFSHVPGITKRPGITKTQLQNLLRAF